MSYAGSKSKNVLKNTEEHLSPITCLPKNVFTSVTFQQDNAHTPSSQSKLRASNYNSVGPFLEQKQRDTYSQGCNIRPKPITNKGAYAFGGRTNISYSKGKCRIVNSKEAATLLEPSPILSTDKMQKKLRRNKSEVKKKRSTISTKSCYNPKTIKVVYMNLLYR